MFKFRKSIIGAIIVGFIVGGISVTATPKVAEIKASINYGIRMVLNGKPFQPMENAKTIRPIIYNGRSYLPVRSLGEALGVAVNWDSATQTIILGERTDKVKLTANDYKGYSGNSSFTIDQEVLDVGDKIYEYGVHVRKIRLSDSHTYHPKAKYSKFGCEISFIAGEDEERTIKFFAEDHLKGTLIKEVTVKKGENKKVEFKIDNVNKIVVDIPVPFDYLSTSSKLDCKIIFGEPYFK